MKDKTSAVRPLRVSDHAIVRYFERKLGVSRKAMAEEILNTEMAPIARQMGYGRFPTEHGYTLAVKNWTVTTVLPSK